MPDTGFRIMELADAAVYLHRALPSRYEARKAGDQVRITNLNTNASLLLTLSLPEDSLTLRGIVLRKLEERGV